MLAPLFVLATHGPARAQSAEAAAMFDEGDRLMAKGEIAAACDAFEASNRVEMRAGTLIRLGECRERNRQLASAWSAYKDALTRVKDPRKREVATARIAAIEPHLSYLTVSVPDDSRVEGLQLARNGKALDPMLWNRSVPVDGGQYIVAGRAPGHEEWQTVVDVPAEGGHVSVEVPKFKEIAKLIAPPPAERSAVVPPAVDTVEDAPPPTTTRWTAKRKLAIGVAGAGAAAAITGGVLGWLAKRKQSEAFGLCPDAASPCADASRADALALSGHHLATGADVAFAIGGAAAVGAGVLWFLGAPSARGHVAIAPGAHGISILGRF